MLVSLRSRVRLVRSYEDECAKGVVLARLGVGPHRLHRRFDRAHCVKHHLQAFDNVCSATDVADSVKYSHCAIDESGRVLDHIDVGQNEARLRGRWVKSFLKSSDQSQVAVLRGTKLRVVEPIVVQTVRRCVRHEGMDVETAELVSSSQLVSRHSHLRRSAQRTSNASGQNFSTKPVAF